MKFKWMFLLLLPYFLKAQETRMSDAEAKAFQKAVSSSAEQTQSLTADFTQTKHMSFLSKPIESKGKLSFKKPGMVLWRYTNPFQYSVLFRDNKIFINDGGRKSDVNAGSSKLFDRLSKIVAGSITGDMFDTKEFVITYYKSGGIPQVRFQPRDATLKKYLKQIDMYFDENAVSEVKMTEPSDDYTRIVFKNKLLNAKIDPAVFNP